ncbi:uncharacterized protein TNCV_2571281 [Trichonephila clavipes]|nr:uncharacterized protein TNCV_2571281 [Trichonephila clavipes]
MPVNVPGCDLRSYCNTSKRRQIATTSSVAVSSSSRKAGGIAIYRNINSFTDCNTVNIDISEINLGMKDAKAVVMSIYTERCFVAFLGTNSQSGGSSNNPNLFKSPESNHIHPMMKTLFVGSCLLFQADNATIRQARSNWFNEYEDEVKQLPRFSCSHQISNELNLYENILSDKQEDGFVNLHHWHNCHKSVTLTTRLPRPHLGSKSNLWHGVEVREVCHFRFQVTRSVANSARVVYECDVNKKIKSQYRIPVTRL